MKRTLTLYLFFFALVCVAPSFAQDEVGDLLGRANNLRVSVGVSGFSLNGALSSAAQSQAQWMVDNASISHTRPDGSGPRSRALNAGYGSSDVSENIYGGTNASADSAWTFWVNSGIHYAGLVNTRYNEVGIGVARGEWGATFVMVFGNSGGGAMLIAAPGGGGGESSAASAPPSYLLGVDENGNLQHQVQPGDTLGDIALIYGRTWDDIPAMMALNGIADVRDLDVGSTFLIPAREGEGTAGTTDADSDDVPDQSAALEVAAVDIPPTPTFTLSPAVRPPTITPYVYATAITFPTVVPVAPPGATAAVILPLLASNPGAVRATITQTPAPIGTAVANASVNSNESADQNALIERSQSTVTPETRGGTSTWIVIALLVQGVVVVGAGVEFARRSSKMRRLKKSGVISVDPRDSIRARYRK